MKVLETVLPGVLIIEPKVFGDARGFFLESYQAERYRQLGITHTFVQDNHSRSARGVLRGLHFQRSRPQGKLVSVSRGSVYDVTVDINSASPTCSSRKPGSSGQSPASARLQAGKPSQPLSAMRRVSRAAC